MKKQLNKYQFDKISTTMTKEFGKIQNGTEEKHAMILIALEGNLLKLYRQDNKRDGRRAIEAIHLCLIKVNGYLTDTEYELSSFLSPENEALAQGLLMGFDPFTNEEIFASANEFYDLETPEGLRQYFMEPVICLIRIEKSIELWTKNMGAAGYFNFLEENIGTTVAKDLKMNFSIQMP